jgi:hypothetical protein
MLDAKMKVASCERAALAGAESFYPLTFGRFPWDFSIPFAEKNRRRVLAPSTTKTPKAVSPKTSASRGIVSCFAARRSRAIYRMQTKSSPRCLGAVTRPRSAMARSLRLRTAKAPLGSSRTCRRRSRMARRKKTPMATSSGETGKRRRPGIVRTSSSPTSGPTSRRRFSRHWR